MAAPGQGREARHGSTAGLKQVGDNRQGRMKKRNCRFNIWSTGQRTRPKFWHFYSVKLMIFYFNSFICRRILFNLLPSHVATHFLDNQFRSNMVSKVITTPHKNVISKIIRTHSVLHTQYSMFRLGNITSLF